MIPLIPDVKAKRNALWQRLDACPIDPSLTPHMLPFSPERPRIHSI